MAGRLTNFYISDNGITLKNTSAGDDKPSILTIASNEAALTSDETIGSLKFQAPDETGTAAITVCASIDIISEGTFDATNNPTKISFKTGDSAVASEKMVLSSTGTLKLKETSAAVSDSDGFGQLWIKNNTPNDLYFTTDAGNDIQITSGDSIAGGSGSSLNDLSDVVFNIDNFSNSLVMCHSSFNGTLNNASNNIGIGSIAIEDIESGVNNIAIGNRSLHDIIDNSNNTAVGALTFVQSGSTNGVSHDYNTSIGYSSKASFIHTTCMGTNAGAGGWNNNNGESEYNTLFGYSTFTSSGPGGPENTSFGSFAGRLSSSAKIVYIGRNAAYRSSGDNNVCIGYHSNYNSGSAATNSNIITLGYSSSPSTSSVSNEITLGDSNITTLRCATNTIVTLSDKRDKTNIKGCNLGLKFIKEIKPVQFTWKRRILTEDDTNYKHNGKTQLGFIAQQLQEAMPNNENEFLNLVNENNPERLEIKQNNLIPVIIKALQELNKESIDLKKQNDLLLKRINNIFII